MEAYLGEIRIFAGTFAPRGWALCNGQTMAITSYQALYSLLGTTYGGDGRSTFALPDMRGRLPMHMGSGPQLTPRAIGNYMGQEQVQLTTDQIPGHNHPMQASTKAANRYEPEAAVLANTGNVKAYVENPSVAKISEFSPDAVGYTGGSEAHENRMPFLCLNYIICIVGTYPSRN